MRATKHAKVCAWCRAAVRSRYRAIVDAYLCETCHHGARAQRSAQPASPIEPAVAEAPLAPPPAAALEQFDLRHLVTR